MKANIFTDRPKLVSTTALASLMAFGVASVATQANAKPWTKMVKTEKCYGVAKAGKNDCATKSHACAGTSKVDNDPADWIFLPVGVCDKLGGHVEGAMMSTTPSTTPAAM
jgi:uncharacterized membrane protein